MKKEQGFSLIEMITSVALAAILLITFLSMIYYTTRINRVNSAKLRANLYLRETVEIAKALELSNSGWSELDTATCATECYPEVSSSAMGDVWILMPGSEDLDNGAYTRSLSVQTVQRDQLTFPNNIVETDGVIDLNTKKITATVTWNGGTEPYVKTVETYVYNQ